jgi:excisionase family DNA binding protein
MISTMRRMRTKEAGEYLNLSASTLEKLRPNGGGPPYYKCGQKIVVYEPQDLDEWLHARRCEPTSEQPANKRQREDRPSRRSTAPIDAARP